MGVVTVMGMAVAMVMSVAMVMGLVVVVVVVMVMGVGAVWRGGGHSGGVDLLVMGVVRYGYCGSDGDWCGNVVV